MILARRHVKGELLILLRRHREQSLEGEGSALSRRAPVTLGAFLSAVLSAVLSTVLSAVLSAILIWLAFERRSERLARRHRLFKLTTALGEGSRRRARRYRYGRAAARGRAVRRAARARARPHRRRRA